MREYEQPIYSNKYFNFVTADSYSRIKLQNTKAKERQAKVMADLMPASKTQYFDDKAKFYNLAPADPYEWCSAQLGMICHSRLEQHEMSLGTQITPYRDYDESRLNQVRAKFDENLLAYLKGKRISLQREVETKEQNGILRQKTAIQNEVDRKKTIAMHRTGKQLTVDALFSSEQLREELAAFRAEFRKAQK